MSAYYIANYRVLNPAVFFNEYIPQVMPLVAKQGGETLVADANVQAVEGEALPFLVVLQFPSRAAAEAWYNDPAYQPVKAIRMRVTEGGFATISDHFVPPQG